MSCARFVSLALCPKQEFVVYWLLGVHRHRWAGFDSFVPGSRGSGQDGHTGLQMLRIGWYSCSWHQQTILFERLATGYQGMILLICSIEVQVIWH